MLEEVIRMDKQQEQTRRLNTGAHLQRAAHAMDLAANAASWDQARSHMKQAAESLRYAAATVMAP